MLQDISIYNYTPEPEKTLEALIVEERELHRELVEIDGELVEIQKIRKKYLSNRLFVTLLITGIVIILVPILLAVILMKNNGNSLLITLLFTAFPMIGIFILELAIKIHKKKGKRQEEWEKSNEKKQYDYLNAKKNKLQEQLFRIELKIRDKQNR